MHVDTTAIHETSTPAEVLAAFLPIVEAAFAEPWKARSLACGGWGAELAVPIDEEVWAVVAASYLMGPLMRARSAAAAWIAARNAWETDETESDRVRGSVFDAGVELVAAQVALDAAAMRLRDYWCEKRGETDR